MSRVSFAVSGLDHHDVALLAERAAVARQLVYEATGTAQLGTRNQYMNSWSIGFWPASLIIAAMVMMKPSFV